MSNTDKQFPKGMYFKEPHPKAPDFVKGQVSVKVEEFKNYLKTVDGEWLNIDLKVSRDGKPYAEINTFKPDKSKAPDKSTELDSDFDDMDDDLPF